MRIRTYVIFIVLAVICLVSGKLAAQPLGNESIIQFLSPGLNKQLAITEKQQAEINKSKRVLKNEFLIKLDDLRNRHLPRHEYQKHVKELNAKLAIDVQNAFVQELSKEQKGKLQKIFLWFKVNRDGFEKVFEVEFVKKELGLTAKQSIHVSKEMKVLQAEFESELQKIRQKYREKLKKEYLTIEQSKTLDEIVGEQIGRRDKIRF